MAEQKATNITWHEGSVTRDERHALLGQKGTVVWMTGLSASGKSTIAVILEQMLLHQGKHAYRLDGDNIRSGLNKNLGFTAEDRAENIRRIGEVAKLFADAGTISIVSFISPYKADRDAVRAETDQGRVHRGVRQGQRWRRPRPATPRGCTRRPGPARSRASPASTTRTRPRPTRRSSSRPSS